MSMYAISRLANYKYSDCGGVLKEALRILPNYDNPQCDSSKSYLNVALIECDLQDLTPEKYILKYREEHDIKGRFNTNAVNKKSMTNCMSQALFTASSDWISQFDRQEQINYFNQCLEFFKSEFPSAAIISAIIHFDETTPHMHVTFLPTVERVNKRTGEIETIFSTTKLMPGKDFFPKYQDRFYKFISGKYNGLDRGKSNYKSLPIQAYKEFTALQDKYNAVCAELDKAYKTIHNQSSKISALYEELRQVKMQSHDSIFEQIPLIGGLFTLLRELREEQRIAVIKIAIAAAEREIKKASREIEEDSLDKKILSASKQKILDSVFGKNTQNKDNRYR